MHPNGSAARKRLRPRYPRGGVSSCDSPWLVDTFGAGLVTGRPSGGYGLPVVNWPISRSPGGEGWSVPDRLLVDLGTDGQATVQMWPEGELPQEVSRAPLAWPLDEDALADLRWYLEDYLRAPFGVWEEHGPAVQARLAEWGYEVFASVFGSGPARDAYQRARDRSLEV